MQNEFQLTPGTDHVNFKCHIWGISLWQYSKLRSYFLGHGGGGGGVLREKKSVNIKKEVRWKLAPVWMTDIKINAIWNHKKSQLIL